LFTVRHYRTVNDPDGADLERVILHGSHIETAQGHLAMPGFRNRLFRSRCAHARKD
jgi:hypothetical protein